MNIRYASLYFVGQIWWASPKLLSRERPCCTVADYQNWRKPKVPSTQRLREGLRAQRHLWPKLTAFVAPILTPKPESGHDGRYSPEVSPRLSWDPTHYVRVREVREDEQGGIIPTQIRILACEFPSQCCFWLDPHRRVLRRINGHFLVMLPPPPWRMCWVPLTKMWAGWSFPPKCLDLFEQTSKRRDSTPDWADMAGELVVGILYNLFLPLLLLAGESPCSFSS